MLNPVIKVSMSNMEYIPKPVDLSKVDLTDDFYNLADIIAKNVHEVWSSNRIKQGWVYGPQRNDELKQHPCLVPYEMLSEEEKQYLPGSEDTVFISALTGEGIDRLTVKLEELASDGRSVHNMRLSYR